MVKIICHYIISDAVTRIEAFETKIINKSFLVFSLLQKKEKKWFGTLEDEHRLVPKEIRK